LTFVNDRVVEMTAQALAYLTFLNEMDHSSTKLDEAAKIDISLAEELFSKYADLKSIDSRIQQSEERIAVEEAKIGMAEKSMADVMVMKNGFADEHGTEKVKEWKSFVPVIDEKTTKRQLRVCVYLPAEEATHRVLVTNLPNTDSIEIELSRCAVAGETFGSAIPSKSGGLCVLFDSNRSGKTYLQKTDLALKPGNDFPDHSSFKINTRIILAANDGSHFPVELNMRLDEGWYVHLMSEVSLKGSHILDKVLLTYQAMYDVQQKKAESAKNALTSIKREIETYKSTRTNILSTIDNIKDRIQHNRSIMLTWKSSILKQMTEARASLSTLKKLILDVIGHRDLISIEYLLQAVKYVSTYAQDIRAYLDSYNEDNGHIFNLEKFTNLALEKANTSQNLFDRAMGRDYNGKSNPNR